MPHNFVRIKAPAALSILFLISVCTPLVATTITDGRID
jgi:hypothetical protein